LNNSRGADNLHAFRLLCPPNCVTDGGGAFPSGVLDQRLCNLQPLLARHTTDTLNHLRRIASEVTAHNLQNAAWMLQRRIGQRSSVCVLLIAPTALIGVRPGFRIEAREESIEVFSIAIVLSDKRCCVRVIHDIVVEITFGLEQMANNRAQENDIASCTCRDI